MLEVTCLDSFGKIVTNLTQWDVNQSLIIESDEYDTAPIFHFCNKNSEYSLGVQSVKNSEGKFVVDVPNKLLTEPYAITVFVYISKGKNNANATSGKTVEIFRLPIKPKPKPIDFKYTDDIQVILLEQLIAEVREFNTQMTNAEQLRENNEGVRKNNENQRIANEKVRQSNENTRIAESGKAVQDCIDVTKDCKDVADKLHESYQKVQQSEGTVLSAEQNVTNIEQNVVGLKSEIDSMVQEYLIAQTQETLEQVCDYLNAINSAKDGFVLNIATGNASSFDVQNIDGGNASTVDPYQYDAGNALSVLN